MVEEKGPFGILPRGPLRKTLFEDGVFKDRQFYGILMKDPDEARGLRRGIVTAVVSSTILAAYLAGLLQRLPERS